MKQLYFLIVLIVGSIALKVNAQITWEGTGNNSGWPVVSIAINSSDHIYVARSQDNVSYSTNDGDTWTNIGSNLPQQTLLTDIAINDNGSVFVSFSEQGVFRTTNNGINWSQMNNGIGENVYSLAIRNLNMYAGTSTGVYRSTNDGVSWTEVNLPYAVAKLAINSNDDVFAAVPGEGLYGSTNSGGNWTDLTNVLISDSLNPVFIEALSIAPNDDIYIYFWNDESNKGIFRSINNGSSWVKRNNGLSDEGVSSFGFNSLGHVFAGVGSPGKVYRTSNNGYQWKDMSDGLTGSNQILGLAVNSNGRMFAGKSGVWRTDVSTTSFTFLGSLQNINAQILFGTPAVSKINFNPPGNMTKQNSGSSVADVEISIDDVSHTRTGDLTFTLEHLGVVDTIIIEVGGNGQDFISTLLSDDSDDQIENGTAPFTGFYRPSRPLDVFSGLDPYGDWTLTIIDGYAGNDGTLNAWSLQINLDSPILNVDDNLGLTPGHFALYQNYPNPFNPTTRIKFQIVEPGGVSLNVYDILGKEVATLVNEELSAGTYEATFDASGLTSGIYFYKLQAGNFVETKKMILLK